MDKLVILVLFLIILLCVYNFYIKKENFNVILEPVPTDFKMPSENLYNNTSITSVDYTESRYPFKVDNTTTLNSPDTPVPNSGYRLGTNLGK